MSQPFEITATDIEQLDDLELTELLRCLLLQEAAILGLPKAHVDVSLKINIPDGGQDGRLEWNNGPEPNQSDWIPSRLNVFQVKATDMGPTACGREVENRDQTDLKPRVKDAIDGGGAYILFTGRHCEGDMVTDRVDAIRDVFKKHVDLAKAETVKIHVYGAEKIAAWTNTHAAAITFVMHKRGRAIPASMQRWEQWNAEHDSHLTFQSDAARDTIVQNVRAKLSQAKGIVRIAGLSGLGKSRLALEAFRPPADPEADPLQAALSTGCVYISDGSQFEDDAIKTMRAMVAANISGYVIVDECPIELHRKLENIAGSASSKLGLLTLDFEPDSDPHSSRCNFYRIERISQSDMESLLKTSDSGLPDEHISTVAAFAQGFPRMAELLIAAVSAGETRLWDMEAIDAFKKLVIRRSTNPEKVWEIAQALSVLEHLGVDGDAEYQITIFTQHFCNETDQNIVYKAIRGLEAAGIAYRRGDFVRVTPLPLAVALAAQWWNGCSEKRAKQILMGSEIPPEMVDATMNQLRRLSGHEWVEKLVAKLYGPDSPFRKRDQLDSAPGSRLAHSLAEVNPDAVCGALYSAFGALTTDEARQIHDGRRHLVWCLEKLVWWPTTFEDAAWVLLLFASGENETWGNNATNQFKHLFHIYLAGTEVPAIDRLKVVRRGLSSGDANIVQVCVDALSEAFTASHFHRISEPVTFSGRLTRSEWQPQTYDEIWRYWNEAMELLKPYLVSADDIGQKARIELANNARGIIHTGGLSILESAAQFVLESKIREWPELLDALRESLIYDGDEYPNDIRERIQGLIERCQPTNIESRLRFIVAKPSWNEIETDESGNVTLLAEERARQFARELSNDPESLIQHLHVVLTDEQRQGYVFGHELGTRIDAPLGFLVRGVNIIQSISPENRNPSVLLGLASATAIRDRDRLRQYLHGLIDDDDSRTLAVDLIRAAGVEDTDIGLLVSLLLQGLIEASVLRPFAYGGALDGVTDTAIAKLAKACLDNQDSGPLIALEILRTRVLKSALSIELLDIAKQILIHPLVLASIEAPTHCYAFEQLAQKVILDVNIDKQFIQALTKWLTAGINIGINCRRSVQTTLRQILETHVDIAWPALCDELQTSIEDPIKEHRILSILGGYFDDPIDLVELAGKERLLNWCAGWPKASVLVARLIKPLREFQEGEAFPSWTPFAIEFLHQNGSDSRVLTAVYANIQSGTWIGSMVPRLTRHRDAFKELTQHQNPDVVRWAVAVVNALDAEITREKKRDEEDEFGIR